jgi:hypothetical protein
VRQSYIVATSPQSDPSSANVQLHTSRLHHPCHSLDILAQPPDTLSISLPHDHTAHEHLDGSNALKRHLALARSLVQTQCSAELVLRHGLGVIDLVTEDDEGGVLELVHGEESVELGFGFVETLVVLCVDEEDDAGNFRDYMKVGPLAI